MNCQSRPIGRKTSGNENVVKIQKRKFKKPFSSIEFLLDVAYWLIEPNLLNVKSHELVPPHESLSLGQTLAAFGSMQRIKETLHLYNIWKLMNINKQQQKFAIIFLSLHDF